MNRTLTLGPGLKLPLDAVTQTIGAIGRKGAGKTYLAQLIAEQMLDAEAQVIAIDPVGNWWGLRVAADGRSPGKDLFVLGGEHGDVPLVPEAGAKVARLLAEKRVSAVLDLSGFRQGERKRFAAEFAEEFFHRKKTQRSPVHVFVEEAQLFIPQRVGPDEARMVGAFESIVRLGRNYGIGATLVTQRPQSVNKEVLSQVECLCVLQVNGTHERKALEEWVQEAGADRKLVGALPGLPRGEGYVWSPSWLRMFQRVRFGQKTTFDASATPEVGRATKAATLSTVDVEALRTDLAEVVKQAEADDPKALRRQISQLERSLKTAPGNVTVAAQVQPIEIPVLSPEVLQRLEQAAERFVQVANQVPHLMAQLREIQAGAMEEAKQLLDRARQLRARAPMPVPTNAATRQAVTLRPVPARARSTPRVESADELVRGGMGRMLVALAQNPDGLAERKLALVTGMGRNGGTYRTYRAKLRSAGYIEGGGPGLRISDTGLQALGDYEPLPTGEALLDHWRRELGDTGMRKMFDALAEVFPESLSPAELASRCAMEPGGGTFRTYRAKLRTLELIDVAGGELRLSRELLG